MEFFQPLIDSLARNRWASAQNLLAPALCLNLRRELLQLYSSKQMRLAGLGRAGQSQRFDPETRSDLIYWLEPHQLTPTQGEFWSWQESLRQGLNRELYLGLQDFEGHFAYYPAGGQYKKHRDQFHGSTARKISFVLYLNENWCSEDGGQLRIFDPANPEVEIERIEPEMGRVVCFSSKDIYHEVIAAEKPRLSLTGWFRAAP